MKTPARHTLLAIALAGLLGMLGAACRPAPVPTVLGTIQLPAGEWPYKIAVNSTTGTAYVLNSNNSVSILQGMDLSRTIRLAQNAPGLSGPIIAQPLTGQVFVFDTLDHLIRVIEPDGTLSTLRDASFSFREAAANPVNGYVYAINLWDRKENGQPIGGSVLVITGTEVITRVPVGRFPSALAINPVNGWIYVGDYPEEAQDYEQMISVISGTQVIDTSDMGQKPGLGGGISTIVIDPRTGQVFAYMNNQRLFALQDLQPVQERFFENPVMQLGFNPVNGQLYAMMIKDKVLVLDTHLRVVGRISIQTRRARAGNRSMAIDPIRGYVYVGSTDDGTLTVIRDTQVITTLQAGWDTTDMGIDPRTGLVYAVNNMSGDVTIAGFPEPTH
jgi:DNA-binding beta-propeller fold protein YncE